ncbi:putative transporter-like protein [Emericellopsis cladophorae]|uniref:Transporter-like protein n=1 Tax=Emericellopsis cladophorae TaxID=2686198 RepID=A0A9P9Y3Y8_9HYPO|nr:putative transporter-like protein [Emericellopsis cladophorae]KAI6782504.1 putative transporter-like protein [Emericellopsis cladophorae]
MTTIEEKHAVVDETAVPSTPKTDGSSSAAAGNDHELPPIDPKAESRLVRKLDLTIYPVFFVIYLMSFLDRINISNAKIQHMGEDINLDGHRFNVALFIYYVSYILLEIPSNMIIKKMRPSLYLSGLMFTWGLINMCMGFVQSYEALVALRFMLGIFEAGVLPGIIYVTSMYYKRHEYQKRMSFFFCSTVVAGAFGGLLAYGIANMDGMAGLRSWRWIFIIEGAATALLAIAASFLVIDWPEQTRFLNADEKELLRRRMALDMGDASRMDTLNRFSWGLIWRDYKIWLGAFLYMGVSVPGLSGTFFLPTILLEFGWKAEEAQVRTIPIYVFAGFCMLFSAWLSDRLKHRFGFFVAGTAMVTLGYSMLLGQEGKSRDYKFGAIFPIFGGAYMVTPMCLGWVQNNMSGHWKRSFASSTQVTIGNIAGIIGGNIFLKSEAPIWTTGYSVALAFMWVGFACAASMAGLMWRENKKRERGERDERLVLPQEDLINQGDSHPSFRFTL